MAASKGQKNDNLSF